MKKQKMKKKLMIFDIYSNGQGINKIFMNDFEEIYHSQGTIRFYAH